MKPSGDLVQVSPSAKGLPGSARVARLIEKCVDENRVAGLAREPKGRGAAFAPVTIRTTSEGKSRLKPHETLHKNLSRVVVASQA